MRRYITLCFLLLGILIPLTLSSYAYAQGGTNWATVEGVVTDAATGQPLPNIEVQTQSDGTSRTKTDAMGRYSLRLVAAYRDYYIRFSDPTYTYVYTWYEHAYTRSEARLVSVTPGQVSHIDMQLERAGVLAVTLNVDEELFGYISIDDIDDPVTGYSNSLDLASSGEYRFVGVSPGRYIVSFIIYDDAILETYTIGYYDAASSKSKADIVEITSGVTSTANLDLTTLGEISGTIRVRSNGQPVDTYSTVGAINEDGNVVAFAATDANGQYRIQHLMPGSYTIQFTGGVLYLCDKGLYCTMPRYRQQLIGNIEVAHSQAISGIDASVRLILEPIVYLPFVMR